MTCTLQKKKHKYVRLRTEEKKHCTCYHYSMVRRMVRVVYVMVLLHVEVADKRESMESLQEEVFSVFESTRHTMAMCIYRRCRSTSTLLIRMSQFAIVPMRESSSLLLPFLPIPPLLFVEGNVRVGVIHRTP